MFCKHDWDLVSETKLPSRLEVMKGCFESFKCEGNIEELSKLSQVVLVQIAICEKCGKLKKLTTSN